MTRAKPLPLEERRQALIDATTPLLLEHGPTVSTRQIAEAAGVAEGTIFRVFESKADLLHACLVAALSVDEIEHEIAQLGGHDLATTLAGVATALVRRGETIRTLMVTLHDQEKTVPHRQNQDDATCERPDPSVMREQLLEIVTAAIEPHTDQLRLPARTVALALVTLSYGTAHITAPTQTLDTTAWADLLLKGVAA